MQRLQRFFSEGATGQDIIDLISSIRSEEGLVEFLRDELLLYAAAGKSHDTFSVDLQLLDDFLNGKLEMPFRAQVLSVVVDDKRTWSDLRKIHKAQQFADSYREEDQEDKPPPEDVMDVTATYSADADSDTLTLAFMHKVNDRWRLESGNPAFNYDIRPRPAARLGGRDQGLRLVDEAVVTFNEVRCAIAYRPDTGRLELHIENCGLNRDAFESATFELKSDDTTLKPAEREFSSRLSRIIFDSVDPEKSHRIEVSPSVFGC